jgi:C4-dicarboxylate-specific signal transduction histidine kinase
LTTLERYFWQRTWFGPAVLAVMFLIVMGTLLSLMRMQFMESRRNDLDRVSRAASQNLTLRLQGNRDYLKVLAEQISRQTLDEETFKEHAVRYVSEHPELLLISFIDGSFRTQWAAPESTAGSTVGLEQLAVSRPSTQKAKTSGKPMYTPLFAGMQGDTVFEVIVPVFRQKQYVGAIVGTYSAQGALRHTLDREVFANHRVQLVDPGGVVLASLPTGGNLVDESLTATVNLDAPGNRVQLQLTRYVASFWNLPILLLSLLCVAMVVGMASGMWALNRHIKQRIRAEVALSEANQTLERRVEARTADLQSANARLQEAIHSRADAERRAREHEHQLAHVSRLSTMGEMATGLAHELNQPLGAIASFAQGCVTILESPTPDVQEVRRALTIVAAQANRAGRIIHRLREFVVDSKPQLVRSDINGLLRDVLELIEMEIRKAHVELSLELDGELGPVMADGIQIQQVFVNLIRNSIEAVSRVPEDQRRVRVVTRGRGEAVEVAVIDSGTGCDEATLQNMFDAFFTTKNTGMGMGLSISRTIIEAHGGKLWATPNADRGLTVTFTLPVLVGETI